MISKEEVLKIIDEELKEWWLRVKDFNIPAWRMGTYKTLMILKEKINE